ncbi:MAG: DUF1499 domain-containing protein [Pseudomonadales bacterium]|nr:DUF1499 domain-containing protein [Pseudomonadales bacterium]
MRELSASLQSVKDSTYWLRLCFILLFGFISACSSSPPDTLGLVNNESLADCPETPNCVISRIDDSEHYIEPLDYTGDQATAKDKLLELINNWKGAKVTLESSIPDEDSQDTSTYIRAEFQSKWFKYVDDVEFFIADKQIQIRSASRLGRSDFGVNRKRIETIRDAMDD